MCFQIFQKKIIDKILFFSIFKKILIASNNRKVPSYQRNYLVSKLVRKRDWAAKL